MYKFLHCYALVDVMIGTVSDSIMRRMISDEYLEMDDYVSTLILEIEQLGQLGRHANVVSLLKVCTVGSKYWCK